MQCILDATLEKRRAVLQEVLDHFQDIQPAELAETEAELKALEPGDLPVGQLSALLRKLLAYARKLRREYLAATTRTEATLDDIQEAELRSEVASLAFSVFTMEDFKELNGHLPQIREDWLVVLGRDPDVSAQTSESQRYGTLVPVPRNGGLQRKVTAALAGSEH